MRWHMESLGEFEDRVLPWTEWFAWRPVFIAGTGMVWLEIIERSGSVINTITGGLTVVWSYRTREDV